MDLSFNVLVQKVPHGTIKFHDMSYKAVCGKTGCRIDKCEGDHATPIGSFHFQKVFYRADRIALPSLNLPTACITAECGWSDDPNDPLYNQYIRKPHPFRHESLYRQDSQYDILVTLSHNQNPRISGAGSAVFFHIAKPDSTGTEGCIAVKLEDMLQILPKITLETKLHISIS